MNKIKEFVVKLSMPKENEKDLVNSSKLTPKTSEGDHVDVFYDGHESSQAQIALEARKILQEFEAVHELS